MFIKYNLYTFILASCMFALNWSRTESLPSQQLIGVLYFDKVAHFAEFVLLSFVLLVGFNKQHAFPYLRFNSIRVGLLLAMSFAVLLQGIHFYKASEHFEWWDLVANWIGCVVGTFVFYVIYKKNDEN